MRQIIKSKQQKNFIQWLKQQGLPQKRNLLLLSLLSLLTFIGQLVLFWHLTILLQSFIVDGSTNESNQTALTILIVSMVILLTLEKIKINLSESTEAKLFTSLQQDFFKQLSKGQYALTRNHSTYFWQQIWLNHLPTIAEFNVRYIVQQRFIMAVPIIVLACVFPLNWVIGLSLIFSLPVVPFFMIIIGKGASALHQKHFKAMARLGGIFVDRIKNLSLLRIFNAHDKQVEILSAASETLNQRTMQVVGVAFLSATVLDFFSTLAVALVAVFVGFNLLGEFTLGGQLNLHTGLFLLLTAPLCFAELKQLGRLYHLRAEALAVAETLIPIFEIDSNVSITSKEITDTKDFTDLHWLNFESAVPKLSAKKINLSKGDWVWLNGQSGSGKTCLLECLIGQRNATHALKDSVLISQHAVILPASIRENLSLGRKIADCKLHDALAAVELDQWLLSQEQGLSTILDEQIPMSGGQKQRLALARILLIDAQVILLDEPTAHLTNEQHRRLSNMIRENFSDKTVIWASHKPLISEWFNQQWDMTEGVLTL